MKSGFVDVHHHLLHGLDDGPASPDETVRMLRQAARQGVIRLAATPHVRPGHAGFDMDLYRERLGQARALAAEEGLEIEIVSGAEIMYTVSAVDWLRRDRVPLLGDGWYALVEFYPDVSFSAICRAAMEIGNAGFGMVLAHAERYRALRWGDRLAQLKEDCGVKVQLNAGAVPACRGLLGDRWVRRILKEGLADVIASDAHNVDTRACVMRDCADVLSELCGRAAARRMLIDQPAAILNGQSEWTASEEEGV